MAQLNPDLFVHCGDVIYADARLVRSEAQGWQNVAKPDDSRSIESR